MSRLCFGSQCLSIIVVPRNTQRDEPIIQTILDACRFVLEDQGEAQSSYWLASIMMEMKLWRASESQVRRALDKDIKTFGDSSPFMKVTEDRYALRSWKGRSSDE